MARRTKFGNPLIHLAYTLVICGAALVLNVGHAKPDSARVLLESEGYTSVSFDGRTMWGCDRSFYRTQFLAKNSRGLTVRGVVCEDFFGGAALIKRK